MKVFRATVLASAVGIAASAHLRARTQEPLANERARANVSLLQELSYAYSSAEAETGFAVAQLLKSKMSVHQAIAHRSDRMSLDEAMKRMSGKIPADVASLLSTHTGREAAGPGGAAEALSADSAAKARVVLNEMIETAFKELDDTLIECKAWENSNRVTYGQVATDLTRLGAGIAKAEETITQSYNCITQEDKEYRSVESTLGIQEGLYLRDRAAKAYDLSLKKNDLAVFTFILDLVRCEGTAKWIATGLMQTGSTHGSNTSVQVCDTGSGRLELMFGNPLVHMQAEKMMTPSTRKAIAEALSLATLTSTAHSYAKQVPGVTASPIVGPTASPVPVKEDPPRTRPRCDTNVTFDCAKLTDTMARYWGKYKDLVDELQAEMDHDQDEWDSLREQLNDQMDVISGQKADCQVNFDQAVGAKNMLTGESDEKTGQHHTLDVEFLQHKEQCERKIGMVLDTDICACIKIRNAVLTAAGVDTSTVLDCAVDAWRGDACSQACDDACPKLVNGQVDPYGCGGTKMLRRNIIVNANANGVQCPVLAQATRCGQFKCPVPCVMSEWSGWSKCSKDCGGGERQRTRSILVKPRNGGKFCDAPVDTEPCNTGSCDRNCALDDWTQWSYCSMACNPGTMPGFKERVRKVIVPIRGQGMCPAEDNPARYNNAVCNDQACIGDEICVARQDLIIALDGSGSVMEAGFDAIKKFAMNLTGSYYPKYYGEDAVRIGVIVFGNGAVINGTTTRAIQVSPLTSDFASVRTSITALQWQRGFTNLAQAFILADTMFQLGGRSNAQSALLVIWDGKPSFHFQTTEAANKLKSKGAMIYMAPISEAGGDWEEPLKEWASQPWETNYLRLPGYDALSFNMNIFSPAVVAKFCPDSISPTLQAAVDDRRGYMLIHEGGFPSDNCGRWVSQGYVSTLDDCAEKALGINYQAFSITEPKSWFGGKRHCYSEAIKFDRDAWKSWLTNRVNVPCPSGTWLNNPYYDVYAIEFFPTTA